MKKIYGGLFALVLSIIFIGSANAALRAQELDCQTVDSATGSMSCNLNLLVTTETGATDSRVKVEKNDEITVIISTFENIKSNTVTITAATGWTIDGANSKTITLTNSSDAKEVTFKYLGNATIDGSSSPSVTIATGTYLKQDTGAICNFGWNVRNVAVCKIINADDGTTQYYGINPGVPVTEDTYYSECFKCNKDTEASDGKFHGLNGKVVTEEEYLNQCGCGLRDGKYYGKDGSQITEGKDGRTIEEEMNYQCFSCTVPDKNGNYYYNGKKLTDEDFTKYCAPKCRKLGDEFFDKDGNKISEDEFKKQCMCRIEETKDGKIYYNDNNEEITAEQYANVCQPNVNTGSGSNPYIFIALGGIAAVGIFFLVKNKNKFKKI